MVNSLRPTTARAIGGAAAIAVWLFAAACPESSAVAAPGPRGGGAGDWLGEELPLPLSVRTPQDLSVKAAAERQYLIFNLLAGGKLAYDRGNFSAAALKWEALLRIPGLDPEVERVIRPLAEDARVRAGGSPSTAATLPPSQQAGDARAGEPSDAASRQAGVVVGGVITGGGALGPGGTVVWLRRADGPTPRPTASRGKVITQRDKTFIPRVLAVPVGTSVEFRNEDDIFHNVFSLSRPNDFDTGLYRQGTSYSQTFRKPGLVQILCNIHASMIAYVYVVDSPYYAQAEANGMFRIKNVPVGEYDLETWNEASLRPSKQHVTVGPDGVRSLNVKVAGDKVPLTSVPDKSGKPRQAHLGY
jgi:plastocyanin